jgi:hypothetical protein
LTGEWRLIINPPRKLPKIAVSPKIVWTQKEFFEEKKAGNIPEKAATVKTKTAAIGTGITCIKPRKKRYCNIRAIDNIFEKLLEVSALLPRWLNGSRPRLSFFLRANQGRKTNK